MTKHYHIWIAKESGTGEVKMLREALQDEVPGLQPGDPQAPRGEVLRLGARDDLPGSELSPRARGLLGSSPGPAGGKQEGGDRFPSLSHCTGAEAPLLSV